MDAGFVPPTGRAAGVVDSGRLPRRRAARDTACPSAPADASRGASGAAGEVEVGGAVGRVGGREVTRAAAEAPGAAAAPGRASNVGGGSAAPVAAAVVIVGGGL
jgi:hypothetical protein